MRPQIRNNASIGIGALDFIVQSADKPWSQLLDETRTYEVRVGDRWNYDLGSTKLRSEIAGRFPLTPGKAYGIAYVQTIEDGPPLTNAWALAGQLHQADTIKGDARSPPFGVYLTRDSDGVEWHVVTVRTSPGAATVEPKTIEVGKVRVVRGQPRAWSHTYIDGSGGPGLLVSYCDGELVAVYRGPTGYLADACYWKEGVYCSEVDAKTTKLPADWSLRVSYSQLSVTALPRQL